MCAVTARGDANGSLVVPEEPPESPGIPDGGELRLAVEDAAKQADAIGPNAVAGLRALVRPWAMLLEESGGDEVAGLLPRTRVSAVILAEVLGRLARDGMPNDALAGVEARLRPLGPPFEAGLMVETARSIRVTRGLSSGDRA